MKTNEKLVADLARFDWEITCEACGAPLFFDDDYVADPEGVSGCWAAMSDHSSKRERPCYAYRVGKVSAAETCDSNSDPKGEDRATG